MPKTFKLLPVEEKLKIVQVTDCHVSADPDAIYREINPRRSIEQLLPVITDWGPDLILLTGDLAEDASDEAYAYLAARLVIADVPVFTLPGNHDHAGKQAHHFVNTAVDKPLIYESKHWRVILLNSAVEGQVSGWFSQSDLERLRKELCASSKPSLIALHHQPLAVGSQWIDRYPLLHPEKFFSCLQSCENVQAVVWGHIHQEFSDKHGEIDLLSAPSSSANSLPGHDRFTFDDRGPACRWLRLDSKGGFETGILRPEAMPA